MAQAPNPNTDPDSTKDPPPGGGNGYPPPDIVLPGIGGALTATSAVTALLGHCELAGILATGATVILIAVIIGRRR